MLQIKSKGGSEGMRVESSNGGEIWLSPARDLFHNYIPFMEKAVLFVTRLKDSDPYLQRMFYEERRVSFQSFYDTVDEMTKLLKAINDPAETKSIKQVCKEHKFDEIDKDAFAVLSYAFMCVCLSAYSHYSNEAKAGTFNPYACGTLESLLVATDDKRRFKWIRDQLNYIKSWIYARLLTKR